MSNGMAYESKVVVEREYPDGHKTYACVVCGMELRSVKSAGGHYRSHVQRGEAAEVAQSKDDALGVDPDWEVSKREQEVMAIKTTEMVVPPPLPDPDEEESETPVRVDVIPERITVSGRAMADFESLVEGLRDLIAPGYDQQQQTIRMLTEELAEAERERDQLRGSLDALRDMISDLTERKGGNSHT